MASLVQLAVALMRCTGRWLPVVAFGVFSTAAPAVENAGVPRTAAELEVPVPDNVDVFDLSFEQVLAYSSSKNFELLGHSYFKGPWRTKWAQEKRLGAGLYGIRVYDGVAYLGGSDYPYPNTFGILIADVRDPRNMKSLSFTASPPGTRTGSYFDVNTRKKIMVVAYDRNDANPNKPRAGVQTQGGVAFYDISDLTNPRRVGFLLTRLDGSTHGFSMDDRYVYLCANRPESVLGQVGHSAEVVIVDYEDPQNPVLVSTFHVQGQHSGETREQRDLVNLDGSPQTISCHEIDVANNRLYVAYRDAGMLILDIEDRSKPQLLSRYDITPPHNGGILGGVHTAWPIVVAKDEHPTLIVQTDEIGFTLEADHLPNDCPPGYGRLIDITDVSNPQVLSTLRIPGVMDVFDHATDKFVCPRTGFHSIHNPWSDFRSPSLLYVTWFDQGLRVFDISNPFVPRETGYYISPRYSVRGEPEPTLGRQTDRVVTDPSTNLVYVTDGNGGGLTVLRWSGPIPLHPPLPGSRR